MPPGVPSRNPLVAPFINSLVTPSLSCVHKHYYLPIEISRYSFHVFVCACPSVLSSIPDNCFHFPFPSFVIRAINKFYIDKLFMFQHLLSLTQIHKSQYLDSTKERNQNYHIVTRQLNEQNRLKRNHIDEKTLNFTIFFSPVLEWLMLRSTR